MRRALISLPLIVVLLGLGFAVSHWIRVNQPLPPAAPIRALEPVVVTVRSLAPEPLTPRITAYGTLLAAREARIAAEVGGRVVAVLEDWRTGVFVARGTSLLRLDGRDHELERERISAQISQAQADAEQAKVELERAERSQALADERLAALLREQTRWQGLVDSGHAQASRADAARAERVTAELDLEAQATRIEQTRARLVALDARLIELRHAHELAQRRFEKSEVRAPFDGWLQGRAPAVGTLLAAGETVATFVDIARLHLVARVPEAELVGIQVGSNAEVTLPGRSDLTLPGRVAAIGVQADVATRTVPVEIDVAGALASSNGGDTGVWSGRLAAGQFAQASIVLDPLPAALALARDELVWRDGRPLAFVFEDGAEPRARARAVELGRRVGDDFVVEGGLQPGELLITGPLRYVSADARVERAAEANE